MILSRLSQRLVSARPNLASIPTQYFTCWTQWDRFRQHEEPTLRAQWIARQQILQGAHGGRYEADCALCQRRSNLRSQIEKLRDESGFREGLVCPGCHLIARSRVALNLLLHGLGQEAGLYVTEYRSHLYRWLRKYYQQAMGSEFEPDVPHRKRRLIAAKRTAIHQDVTALTFADDSFDGIASFDVLEHVPDFRSALRQFHRCLRPNGRLIMTVPFVEHSPTTAIRAKLEPDGAVTHLLPAEYHRDPSQGAILCYYNFGWDILDDVRDAGFEQAHWVRVWSPDHAIFGLWTLSAVA